MRVARGGLVCFSLLLLHVRDAATRQSMQKFDELFEASLSLESPRDEAENELKVLLSRVESRVGNPHLRHRDAENELKDLLSRVEGLRPRPRDAENELKGLLSRVESLRPRHRDAEHQLKGLLSRIQSPQDELAEGEAKSLFSRLREWKKFRSNSDEACKPGVTPCYRANKAVYPNRRSAPCYADDRGRDFDTAESAECSCPCCSCNK